MRFCRENIFSPFISILDPLQINPKYIFDFIKVNFGKFIGGNLRALASIGRIWFYFTSKINFEKI